MQALGLGKRISRPWCAVDHVLVLSRVLLAPLVIFKRVLNHGHANDKGQGHERGRRSIKILQARHQLQHRHEEEVGVGHLAELFEQVLGQERGASVLGGLDLVVHELSVQLLCLELLVDLEDASGGRLVRLLVAAASRIHRSRSLLLSLHDLLLLFIVNEELLLFNITKVVCILLLLRYKRLAKVASLRSTQLIIPLHCIILFLLAHGL